MQDFDDLNEHPLVSVIIPVFNGQIYLARCLDSVMDQTMQDFELIVVDDGSTDATPAILREYAAKCPTMRVVTQDNAGQGAARNLALTQARGRYVLFVDADDLIERVTLQVTTERAEQDSSDLVHFDWKFIRTHPDHLGKYDYYNIEPFWHQRMLEGAECEQLFRMHSYFSVTNLYRRSFLEDHSLRYEEGQIYEDNPFLAQVFSLAESVSLVHSPLYAIQANPQSSTKLGADTPRHMRDHLSAVRKSFERIKPRGNGALGDLAEYHLEKFSIYYGRRVPRELRAEYAREFVSILAAQDLQFVSLGRKTSWLTKLCVRFGIFEHNKPAQLQRLIEGKDLLTPPAKKVLAAAKKTKRRMRHPLRTINTVISGKTPAVREGTILFLGFDYRYTGNSRALFEELLADERFDHRKILFATTDERVPANYRVRPESLAFTRAAQHAEFLIAETWIPASVPKNPGSTWIQLWHGTPIKRMLFDSHEKEITSARPAHKVNKYKDIQRWDFFVVDGELAAERFGTAFLIPQGKLLFSTLPRVYRLLERRGDANCASDSVFRARQATAEPKRRVILYAPTWRDYNYRVAESERDRSYLLDFDALPEELFESHVILFKDHGFAPAGEVTTDTRRVLKRDDDIEDLMLLSDVFMTDVSSALFDAKEFGIPTITMLKDIDQFVASRGLYGIPETSTPQSLTPEANVLLELSQANAYPPGEAQTNASIEPVLRCLLAARAR